MTVSADTPSAGHGDRGCELGGETWTIGDTVGILDTSSGRSVEVEVVCFSLISPPIAESVPSALVGGDSLSYRSEGASSASHSVTVTNGRGNCV